MCEGERFAALPSFAVAAHELKSPLALIRQLSLVANSDTYSDDERRDSLEQLTLVATRSLGLVDDLTQAISMQPTLFPLEPVNPSAICREIASDLIPMARLYGQRISWPPARSRVLVVANRRLLVRILTNFLDNAFKYTELHIPIRVRISRHGDTVRVGVRDYGPRMTTTEYRKMLDELGVVKTARTRPDSSGLGIFLASEFAKMMSGQIGVTRHRDGVTFFVELPLSGQMSLL